MKSNINKLWGGTRSMGDRPHYYLGHTIDLPFLVPIGITDLLSGGKYNITGSYGRKSVVLLYDLTEFSYEVKS